MAQRYTRSEVGRILGLESSRLQYWERLRLIRPQARWGQHFYSFGDLVAVRTIQRMTQNRIPARQLRRAVTTLEQEFGESPLPIHELRLLDRGREVVVIPPGATRPFNPIRRQWVLPFESPARGPKLHSMTMRSAQELFDAALRCEDSPELLPEAIETYRRVVEQAPHWIEAHINLGVAYYQTGRLSEARDSFISAVQIDPENGISRYNLGCVLEEQGDIDRAIDNLRHAARLMPSHPDVHFNLALAYEKRGDSHHARDHWKRYLRHAPSGQWADQARARLRACSSNRRKPSAPIPFPRKA